MHREGKILADRRRDDFLGLLGGLVGGFLPSKLVVNEDGGTDSGQVQFRELVKQGVLQAYDSGSSNPGTPGTGPSSANANPDGRTPAYAGSFSRPDAARLRTNIEKREPRRFFAGANGFVREWDACSSTPFLRSEEARQVVTYDDPVSLEMKSQLVRQAGMLGANIFDIHGDTDEWDLTDALRRGLGLL